MGKGHDYIPRKRDKEQLEQFEKAIRKAESEMKLDRFLSENLRENADKICAFIARLYEDTPST